MDGLNATPKANRLHIGIFGKRNAGKSSFINALTGQNIAIVSSVPGTTADPVSKTMEIHPIGPCVLIDTAGFDDEGELGNLRVEKTKEAAEHTDVAVLIISPEGAENLSLEKEWLSYFDKFNIPVITLLNKSDINKDKAMAKEIETRLNCPVIEISSKTGFGIDLLKEMLIKVPKDFEMESITGHIVKPKDNVLLVMPQDIQAPKGRLILPQVQVIRELLDIGAVPTCVTTENMKMALSLLKNPPSLIITDSQVFKYVYDNKPKESKITSFSVLLARYKGDIDAFIKGAHIINSLTEKDTVLIAEACTHNPLDGDIGRIKIPNLLRKKVGEGLKFDIVSGNDFPKDLSKYALIIHCAGCMFNRRYVLSRIFKASSQNIPITNYGITLAFLSGILDDIDF